MAELSMERKIAVDTLHFAGHTPLYIETEPEVKDQAAKKVMDSFIQDAEAILLIYYLSEGRLQPLLGGLSPIEYEFLEFRKHHSKAPFILFQKTPEREVHPSGHLIQFFELEAAKEAGAKIIQFSSHQKLATSILKEVKKYKLKKDKLISVSHIIIRYTGPDFIGLIGIVSEILFSHYKLNIDYISHAGRGGLATLYIACSPRGVFPDFEVLKNDLLSGVRGDLRKATKQGRLINSTSKKILPEISIDEDRTPKIKKQYYLEVRTIDTPGQLNAVCKVLRDLRFNIDELQLKPTSPQYPRQTTMALWVSKRHAHQEKDYKPILMQLETTLDDLIGVRSFSINLVNQ